MRRLTWALVPLCLAFGTGRAHAYTPDDTLAAIDGASATYGVSAGRLRQVVDCETGHTLEPSLVGDHGTSFGVVQLHRGGALAHYLSLYSDPFDPYTAVAYLARALRGEFAALGIGAWSWTCA